MLLAKRLEHLRRVIHSTITGDLRRRLAAFIFGLDIDSAGNKRTEDERVHRFDGAMQRCAGLRIYGGNVRLSIDQRLDYVRRAMRSSKVKSRLTFYVAGIDVGSRFDERIQCLKVLGNHGPAKRMVKNIALSQCPLRQTDRVEPNTNQERRTLD